VPELHLQRNRAWRHGPRPYLLERVVRNNDPVSLNA
jgi:hypothetical protein